jgi:RNA polymerase sigma-70 factor (ECF subfamily)
MKAMTSSEDDETAALIERIRLGDDQALGALFERYRPRLNRMVEARLDPRARTRVSAADVVQDIYIDAVKRIEHFRAKPTMSFFAWIRWVANQRIIDVHRRHLGARMRDAGQEWSLDRPMSVGIHSSWLADQLAGSFTSPSEAVMKGEILARLEHSLETLASADRELLALRHFEELSNLEVAEILGITPAAASKRYVRALKRLKDLMADTPTSP